MPGVMFDHKAFFPELKQWTAIIEIDYYYRNTPTYYDYKMIIIIHLTIIYIIIVTFGSIFGGNGNPVITTDRKSVV